MRNLPCTYHPQAERQTKKKRFVVTSARTEGTPPTRWELRAQDVAARQAWCAALRLGLQSAQPPSPEPEEEEEAVPGRLTGIGASAPPPRQAAEEDEAPTDYVAGDRQEVAGGRGGSPPWWWTTHSSTSGLAFACAARCTGAQPTLLGAASSSWALPGHQSSAACTA